jgi:phage terminase large subunit
MEEGRISDNVPFHPDIPVDVYFDIGRGDNTAIWFAQVVGRRINIIHYYQNRSKGAEHYAQYLSKIANDRGYIYGQFNYPWDANSGNWATEYTPVAMMEQLYPNADHVVQERVNVQIGINAVRSIFPLCSFHETSCKDGLKALNNYRRKYDEKKKEFHDEPYHDWASDGADAFRYLALGITIPDEQVRAERNKRIRRSLNKVPDKRRNRSWMTR